MVVIMVCIVAIELLLRLSGVFRTSEEKRGKPYNSSYGEVRPTWYSNHKAYDTLTPPTTDFHYIYYTNKYGLREKDYSTYKSDSAYRILITGNSYIEGSGAPYDSTWPRLLEKELRNRNLNVEVIDAGLAGNDILFDYVYYRDKLNAYYHPDLVIATMNSSDYLYYAFRGGMERFHADGTVHYLPVPHYDFLFQYSHLFRGLLALSGFPVKEAYLSKRQFQLLCEQATLTFAKEIKNYKHEVDRNNSKFVCIFYPKMSDVRFGFFFKNSLHNFDELTGLLEADSIAHFSLFTPFVSQVAAQPKNHYSYPNDGHYTPKGYQLLARLTADSLIASGAIKN